VLLLGPLYHLTRRADRSRALTQARRVVRPGGVVASVISRYVSTFDGSFRDFIDEPGFAAMMAEDRRTGQHRNPGRDAERFTTAYFHDRDGITAEITDAGLLLGVVLPVEGPLQWALRIRDRLADPAQRQLILDVLTVMEPDPALTDATAHLLAIGYRE